MAEYEPDSFIPESKDIWGIIIKNGGILEKKIKIDDYGCNQIVWAGLSKLKNLRLACKPMKNALSRIDLATNDFVRSTSLKGVLNFKKCFPNTKSSFRINQKKNGDIHCQIYLDYNLNIISIATETITIYPIDTSECDQFKYDIVNRYGHSVFRSHFFKEMLQVIIENNGLPEGIDGFVYETCIYSDTAVEGIDQLTIYINNRLEFDTLSAEYWDKDIVLIDTIVHYDVPPPDDNNANNNNDNNNNDNNNNADNSADE